MLLDIVKKGTTDYSTTIRIVDSADGTPETGVVFNTAGIDLWYRRPGAAHTSITEATQTEDGAHADGGFVHISDGNYRLDLPDAAVATGVDYVDVGGTVTGMVVIGGRIRLTNMDLSDGVRGGMTALPNAAADAAGGLPISDVGGLDLDDLKADVTAILADTGTDGVAISSSTIGSIADQVWDESAADHVAAGSFGASNTVFTSGTAQAGTGTTIQLAASGPSDTDDFYNNCLLVVLSGTGAGQSRFITDYTGSTHTATVDTWITNPSTDSVYAILPFGSIPGASAPTASEVADAVWDELSSGHTTSGSFGQALGGSILRTATAQAGGASTITLDASASATNDLYNLNVIRIISGTGAGQSRQVSDYVGSSKVATVSIAWTTQPSSDSVFQIIALGVDAATVASIADAVWDEARSGHITAGSFGERVNANVTQISGDTTAADNLEAAADGTGYNLGGGSIVAASVTGNVGGNVTGSVGSVSGVTFPTNFGDLAITVTTGKVTIGTNDDKTGYSLAATQTFDMTGDITGNLSGSVGSVTGAVGSVTGNVGGNVVGTVGSLAAQAKADVNAEVVDVVTVDTIAELTGDPGSTPTLAEAAMLPFMAIRNKRDTTATADEIHNDAGAVVLTATLSDDATTFSKTKYT